MGCGGCGGGPCSYGGAGVVGGNVSADDGSEYRTVNSLQDREVLLSDLDLVSSGETKYRNRFVQPETYDYSAHRNRMQY